MSDGIFVSRHPLVLNALAGLRNRATPAVSFRKTVHDLAQLLFVEASHDLRLEPCIVETPLAQCQGDCLAEKIGMVPILRAGLGMAEAILDLIPSAQVWHLGLYRDHTTHQPITYYSKLHSRTQLDVCYVVDPMLATGGSAVAAIDILKGWGIQRIKFIGLIAAPEGVQAMRAKHPDVPLHLAALDSHLNELKYIVPGLGDAGDRQFGTQTE